MVEYLSSMHKSCAPYLELKEKEGKKGGKKERKKRRKKERPKERRKERTRKENYVSN